ncbi:endonuclease/exonuclease/phosphatase family protein [Echinicola jeungdonensis]|uniref:Endonuclease/exonuclease/phosphatase family protein n=2 Tax=Echinicola jeungdonensis TaxID=709343 RepID=A0ABV5J8M8_9BACT
MKIALYIFSALVLIAGIMPLVKKDYWTFRVFDYPRVQKLLLTSTLLIIWISAIYPNLKKVDYGVIFLLLMLFIYLLTQILPFSIFGKKMVKSANKHQKTSLHLLVGNVYQFNKNYQKTIRLIQNISPDIFMLVETDQFWANEVSALKNEYPYHIEIPLDNTYGLLFYSKFKITNQSINYLINEDIPSIIVDMELPDQRKVRVYGLHPTPPVPWENTHSTERDAEILIVGKLAKAYGKPSIIIGDLNDVAWSYANDLFLKISGMGDPRRGRGMYSTFHAKYPWLRWPLDHIFLSPHFKLKKLKVQPNVGSDHFPISAQVVLDLENENEQFEADQEDKKEAMEKIARGVNF